MEYYTNEKVDVEFYIYILYRYTYAVYATYESKSASFRFLNTIGLDYVDNF